jgi:formylglycine-generating enzyme required for sulfatase activity
MEKVSWHDADEVLCQKLSQNTGRREVRLPSVEWEYAKGGNQSKGYGICRSYNLDEVG